MKKAVILYKIFFIVFAGLPAQAQPYNIIVNTVATPQVNPKIEQAFGRPINGITVAILCSLRCQGVSLMGKLERLTPSPFTVQFKPIRPNFLPVFDIMSGARLTSDKLYNAAFNNFADNDWLIYSGISSIADIKEAGEVKLPPGQYKICFAVTETFQTDLNRVYLSDPNLGCAFFTICNDIQPPQFSQPISSNFSVNAGITQVPPTPVVNFAWTPPLAACGSPGPIQYELEIWEIQNNQTVLDAINNPFVFKKEGILSTTFLLDLNLYQDVLKRGKKYAIRVKGDAMNPNPLYAFENNGYSRVESFQFGSETIVTSSPGWNPQLYFIPLKERKSNFWENYEARRGRDTLVPVEEYIAYKLMQQGVAYNEDAIELLLSLNPELKDQRVVKLYQPLKLPEFPDVPADLQRNFDQAHANNIKPDNDQVLLFRRYLDSLKRVNRVPDAFAGEFSELRSYLERFNVQAPQLNGVSMGFVNAMLSDMLFTLRQSSGALGTGDRNHLSSLASDVRAIAVIPSPASSSIDLTIPGATIAAGASKAFMPGLYSLLAAYPYLADGLVDIKEPDADYAITDQLIPLDVIVYRAVPPPGKPIFNAPDLKASFRVFYKIQSLYNSRNPQVNADRADMLASTTQVSLPRNLEYKFWTVNMLSLKSTLPMDVSIDEVFTSQVKKEGKGSKTRIVLKVE